MYRKILGTILLAGVLFTGQVSAQDAERDPILIIPGIGGSMNWDVLVSSLVFRDNWTLTDNTYDSLLLALQAQGYVLDKDLFIVFYDWRKSNSDSADDYLVSAIDRALENSPSGKVDIIAHSMGGLVAR